MAAEGFARRGIATPHDLTVARELATVLTGGDTDIIDTDIDVVRQGLSSLMQTDSNPTTTLRV
ncbi:MAG: hypothetical protein ABGW90_04945, partial [Martelella sp.]